MVWTRTPFALGFPHLDLRYFLHLPFYRSCVIWPPLFSYLSSVRFLIARMARMGRFPFICGQCEFY